MIRAIVKNGLIEPLEPLPLSWRDGREVVVRDTDLEYEISPENLDALEHQMNELASQMDLEDSKQLLTTLDELRAEQKKLMELR